MARITPLDAACGAVVTDVDLAAPLAPESVVELRRAWLEHHVLVFPDQPLTAAGFQRVVEQFGPIGDDPFLKPVDGLGRIAAVQRRADETGRIFADVWHSDWSFQPRPPAATCLYGVTIPPLGGDTLFSNQHKALDEMPPDLRRRIEGKLAVHSAGNAYADDGAYSKQRFDGSMAIRTSDEARTRQTHPLVRAHPETGRPGLFGGSYVLDLADTPAAEAAELIAAVKEWQGRASFVYRHRWQPQMLVMWDNRSVLHCATGGYEGHERYLYRLTIADDPHFHVSPSRRQTRAAAH